MHPGRRHEDLGPEGDLLVLDLLARGEAVVVTCAGGSMEPTVPRGAKVLVRPGAAAPGDVALLRTRDGFVLHRILLRLPLGLVVHRGDRPGARPGLGRWRDVLGRADLPPRRRRGLLRAPIR